MSETKDYDRAAYNYGVIAYNAETFKGHPTEVATDRALEAFARRYEQHRKPRLVEREQLDADERKAFETVLTAATEVRVGEWEKVKAAIKLVREVLADAFPEPKPAPKKTPGEVLYDVEIKEGPNGHQFRWELVTDTRKQEFERRAQAQIRFVKRLDLEEDDKKQPAEQSEPEPEPKRKPPQLNPLIREVFMAQLIADLQRPLPLR